MAKKAVNPADAKKAKQKKILIGGGVLLLVLLAIQVPSLMKRMHGDSSMPAWRVASQQAAAAAPAPAVGLAAPTLAGGNPTGATQTSTTGLVAETAPTAAVGQLASFGRFASKDPFAAQTPPGGSKPTTPAPPTPPTVPGGGEVPSSGGGSTTTDSSPPTPPAPAPTSAVIAVNGVQGAVTVGSDFPQPSAQDASLQPMFHLVSLTQHSAKIAIAGGSYANGAAALTLKERKPVTLMNTSDGTRYTIQLFPQGTQLPATGSTTGGAVTTVATVPAVTTTSTTSTTKTTP
jgi:hypothetical protein